MVKKKLQGDNRKMIGSKAFKTALLAGLLLSLPYYSTFSEAQDFKKASNPASVNASGSFTVGDGLCADNTSGTITIDCTQLPIANFGSINVMSSTPPAAGVYLPSGNNLGFSVTSGRVFFMTTSFLSGNATNSAAISAANSSSTNATVIPNRTATTIGLGGDGTFLYDIISSVAVGKWGAQGLYLLSTIPSVSGTGTPTIAAGSSDSAGEVTSGTTATSVVITFSATKTNAPFCVVTSQTQLAIFSYIISTTAITITQTATSAEKIDYHCIQH